VSMTNRFFAKIATIVLTIASVFVLTAAKQKVVLVALAMVAPLAGN